MKDFLSQGQLMLSGLNMELNGAKPSLVSKAWSRRGATNFGTRRTIKYDKNVRIGRKEKLYSRKDIKSFDFAPQIASLSSPPASKALFSEQDASSDNSARRSFHLI